MPPFRSVSIGSTTIPTVYHGASLYWTKYGTGVISPPIPRYTFRNSLQAWQLGLGSVAGAAISYDASDRVTLPEASPDTLSGSLKATMTSTADTSGSSTDGTLVVESGRTIRAPINWSLPGRYDADRIEAQVRVDGPASHYSLQLITSYLKPGDSSLSTTSSDIYVLPTGGSYQLETQLRNDPNVPAGVLTMIQNVKLMVIDSKRTGGNITLHLNNIQQAAADVFGPQTYIHPSGSMFLPETYGAIGDGVTDDSAAIQAAINASVAGGSALLGNKTYLCNAQLELPSNASLYGSGPESILKFTWFDQSAANNPTQGPYFQNVNTRTGDTNITLVNFSVVGVSDGLPAGPSANYPLGLAAAFRLIFVSGLYMSNIRMTKIPGTAVTFQGVNNAIMRECYFDYIGRGPLGIFWNNATTSDNISILRNKAVFMGDDAYAIDGVNHEVNNESGILPTNIRINDNYAESWPSDPNGNLQGRGVCLLGVRNSQACRNVMRTIPGSGVLLRSSNDVGQINPVTNQPWEAEAVLIADNIITNIGQSVVGSYASTRAAYKADGIEIGGGTNVTIRGNTVANVLGVAIDDLR